MSPSPDTAAGRPAAGTLLRSYARFVALVLVVLGASRGALVLWQWDRVSAVDGLATVLLQGVRFDLVVIGIVFLPLVVLTTPLLAVPVLYRWVDAVRRYSLFAVAGGLLFLEGSTPNFIGEYDTRPNYLFVEYLKYPREVLSTLWGAYKWQLIAMALLSVPAAILLHRLLVRRGRLERRLGVVGALAVTLGLSAVSLGMARSTLAHRPVNPSTVAFSTDPLVNTLPLPSGYTVGYAIYQMRRHESGEKAPYGRMDYDNAIALVRESMGLPSEAFPSEASPLLHHQAPTRPRERPLNLVVVLEESLGAEFIGCMGGLPLSPEIDRWSERGMWFEWLYATGTRSVRGIEAVLTSFPPTPSRSVVKLPRSQRDFFTIAALLRRNGYDTSFLYGGEAHFDNMRRFFTGNGFERVVDEGDYDDPIFTGSWGVSDEDLFARAHDEFSALHQQGKPFFSLVFSSSNHSPFEYPEDRIEPYEEPAATRYNASKYADWALGRFLDQAEASEYWDDTVFLVVADHCSRVFGASLVPVEHFHVPAMFLGGTIAPERVSTLASQIDLLPTALSLIGLAADHPSPGRDLTRPEEQAKPGRAILQYYDTHAHIEGERVVLLRPDQAPAAFLLRDEQLLPAESMDEALLRRARAWATWPIESYRRRDYRLAPEGMQVRERGTVPASAPR